MNYGKCVLVIKQEDIKNAAYADEKMGAGSLHNLSKWWHKLTKRGPSYRNYPNAVKSLLLMKLNKKNLARKLFNGTSIKIASTGAWHLVATMGSRGI